MLHLLKITLEQTKETVRKYFGPLDWTKLDKRPKEEKKYVFGINYSKCLIFMNLHKFKSNFLMITVIIRCINFEEKQEKKITKRGLLLETARKHAFKDLTKLMKS